MKYIHKFTQFIIKRKIGLLVVILIIFIWSLPIEDWFNVLNTPNQDGKTTYKDSEIRINLDGGFVYNIEENKNGIPKIISIKLFAPNLKAKINMKNEKAIRINIINAPKQPVVDISNQSMPYREYKETRQFDKQLQNNKLPTIDQLQSYKFINSAKGLYFDTILKVGDNELTIKPKNTKTDYSFYIVSDLHSGYQVAYKQMTDLMKSSADFLVFNGDIVDWGNKAEYIIVSGLTDSSYLPIYTNVGNHEDWQNGIKFYQSYFGPLQKSFVYSDSLFVFLDSYSGSIGNKQFSWLNSILKNSQEKYKFVFCHIPALNAHTKEFDNRDYKQPQMRQNLYNPSESLRLLNMLNEYNVNYLFSGHDHVWSSNVFGEVTQTTTGSFGGKMTNSDTVSYLKVDVSPTQAKVTNLYVEGNGDMFNKEHFDKSSQIKLLAKPFFYDKWISVVATIAVIGAYVIIQISSKIIHRHRVKIKSR